MNIASVPLQTPLSPDVLSLPAPQERVSQRYNTRLRLLQEHDRARPWTSLEDCRVCLLCESEFQGGDIRIHVRNGKPVFQCPGVVCPGGLEHFVHPGNPLLNDETWHDWMRMEERREG